MEPASLTIRRLTQSWERTLLAENKSPSTIAVYTSAVARLAVFLEGRGHSLANGRHNEGWEWEVPEDAPLPDVGPAIDLTAKYQPESGPMRPPTAGGPRT